MKADLLNHKIHLHINVFLEYLTNRSFVSEASSFLGYFSFKFFKDRYDSRFIFSSHFLNDFLECSV